MKRHATALCFGPDWTSIDSCKKLRFPHHVETALAFSGGGGRAFAFSLGVLRALEHLGLMRLQFQSCYYGILWVYLTDCKLEKMTLDRINNRRTGTPFNFHSFIFLTIQSARVLARYVDGISSVSGGSWAAPRGSKRDVRS